MTLQWAAMLVYSKDSTVSNKMFIGKAYQDVVTHVSACKIFQQTTYHQLRFGLLQPIPPPKANWEAIAMDFIVVLPTKQGNTV